MTRNLPFGSVTKELFFQEQNVPSQFGLQIVRHYPLCAIALRSPTGRSTIRVPAG